MRKKRVELEQKVIAAAFAWKLAKVAALTPADPADETLIEAIEALDQCRVAELTGVGARWAEGSDTSRLAASMAFPTQASTRREIIALLAQVGAASDRMMETALRRTHQTVSSARNWLVEAGWVRDSGRRVRQQNGRLAALWVLTDAAIVKIREEGAT